MAGTKRVPLERVTNTPTITAKAIEIFNAMEKCERARRRAPGCTLDDTGYCLTSEGCKPCAEWWGLHNELHRELEHVPPQLNQGDSRGAEDGRG
jgi:hypothetical protein